MIWSPGRKYLFIHIPKTGGTSMALALEGRAMKDDVMLGDTPKAVKRRRRLKGVQAAGRLWKHSTLADLAGLAPRDALDRLFIFTLVRNPWDRVGSYYRWLRTQRFDHPAVHVAQGHDFAGFLEHPDIAASLQANPAARYVTDAQGQMRGRLFIRLEHFEADAAPLFEHLGFALELPHLNATEAGSAALYTQETAARVAELCAEDIARFGYAFPNG